MQSAYHPEKYYADYLFNISNSRMQNEIIY